jgi:hypothetical protein
MGRQYISAKGGKRYALVQLIFGQIQIYFHTRHVCVVDIGLIEISKILNESFVHEFEWGVLSIVVVEKLGYVLQNYSFHV